MAAIARAPDRTNGGFQTTSVNAATNTKPNQTTRNLTEPLRVDSIFGIGAKRSKIGVGLAEVCVTVALTARKSLTRENLVKVEPTCLSLAAWRGQFARLAWRLGHRLPD